MSFLDGYKINKAINTLLDAESPTAPEAITAAKKLNQIGRHAVPKLIDALLDSTSNQLIEKLLLNLLDNKSLPDYTDGLTEPDRHLLASLSRILAKGTNYDPNHLLKLLDDPEIPKKILLQILIAKKDRLSQRKVIALLETNNLDKRNLVFHLIHAIANQDCVHYLVPFAESSDSTTRIQSIRTLAKFSTETVKNILINALTDNNKIVRQMALEGLSDFKTPVESRYICPLLKDPDITVQTKAIEALVKIKDPNTVVQLIEILNDDSEYIRRAAVEVLNEIADQRAIKDLLNAMRDSDWWVRVRAADALGSIGGPRVVEAIIGLLQDKDEFMRRTAVEILNSVKDERAYFYLIQALDDEDWWVRERAVDALGHMGNKEAIPNLYKTLDSTPDSAHIIIQAIINLGGDQVVPELMQRAQNASGKLRKEMMLAISEFAKKEDFEQNTSISEENTKLIQKHLKSTQGQNDDSATILNQKLPSTEKGQKDNSAGILDLSEKDENKGDEVAQIFDAGKFKPGYILADRYRVEKQIGKGAFGVVVLVEDMMVSDSIILKFLNAHMSSDENIIQRFIQELRYARKVTHENIIRIYDFITFGSSYAISMEYFESHSLAYEMKVNKNPDVKRIVKIFADICSGVGYAHSIDIVHRDLKPANILINDDNEVKIVDFGLAAAASSADSRLTKTGILVGTPTYMAPEQVRARAIDQRTDIYSLGILLYEIFVGKAPYKGEDHLATLFLHVEGKAVPAHIANPKITKAISDVIMKAISVLPDNRYQTAEEFSAALEVAAEEVTS